MTTYVAHNMNTVDIPGLSFAPDSLFSYSGNAQVIEHAIKIPGLPMNQYNSVFVFGANFKVALIAGTTIAIYTTFPRVGDSIHVDFRSGYARDDGRNKSNWRCEGLTISEIDSGRVVFEENLMVGRSYTLTLLNPIVKADLTVMPRGTEFSFYCPENFAPTYLESTSVTDGLVTLTFSNPLAEDEGYIYGIEFDRVEYDENKILIYTSIAGEVTFEVQDLFDAYGNSIEDMEVTVHLEAIADTIRYLDEDYHIRRKSHMDYEDVVLAESYQWLRDQQET